MAKHSSDYIGLVAKKCEQVGLKGWPLTLGTDEAHAHQLTGPMVSVSNTRKLPVAKANVYIYELIYTPNWSYI